jgi:hypothetical protein
MNLERELTLPGVPHGGSGRQNEFRLIELPLRRHAAPCRPPRLPCELCAKNHVDGRDKPGDDSEAMIQYDPNPL